MEKKVKDIMVPIERCPTISAGSSVKEAVALLNKTLETGPRAGNASVLVMAGNHPEGVVGIREILRAVEPPVFKGGTYRGWTVPADWSPPLFPKGIFTEKCHALADRRVVDIMSPVTQQLKADDTLIKAVHILVAGGFENVPVWQDDRVVGMIGNLEMVDEIATAQLQSETGARYGRKKAAG